VPPWATVRCNNSRKGRGAALRCGIAVRGPIGGIRRRHCGGSSRARDEGGAEGRGRDKATVRCASYVFSPYVESSDQWPVADWRKKSARPRGLSVSSSNGMPLLSCFILFQQVAQIFRCSHSHQSIIQCECGGSSHEPLQTSASNKEVIISTWSLCLGSSISFPPYSRRLSNAISVCKMVQELEMPSKVLGLQYLV